MASKNTHQQILQDCAVADRSRLLRLQRQCQQKKATPELRQQLAAAIEDSMQKVQIRHRVILEDFLKLIFTMCEMVTFLMILRLKNIIVK